MFPLHQQAVLPLRFEVDLHGLRQSVTVTADCSDEEAFRYQVQFQDGTTSVFSIEEGPSLNIRATEAGLQAYADALLPDLYLLAMLEPGSFFYILSYDIAGRSTNLWLMEQEPDQAEQENFGVFYDQLLRMEIFKDGSDEYQWRNVGLPLSEEEAAIGEDLVRTFQAMQRAIRP